MARDLDKFVNKINGQMSIYEDTDTYNKLSNNKVKQSFVGVRPFYPSPSDKDYSKGFIYRQFVMRYDGSITEVSAREGSRKKGTLTKGMYFYIVIKWQLVESSQPPRGLVIDNPNIPRVNAYYIEQGLKDLPKPLQATFRNYFINLEEFKLQD